MSIELETWYSYLSRIHHPNLFIDFNFGKSETKRSLLIPLPYKVVFIRPHG